MGAKIAVQISLRVSDGRGVRKMEVDGEISSKQLNGGAGFR